MLNNRPHWLVLLSLLSVSAVFLLPFGMLLVNAMIGETDDQLWQHLWNTSLSEALINSCLVAIFSTLIATLLGTSLAWLTVVYRFAGSRWLNWLMILPLAFPPYVVAMILLWWGDSGGSLHLWFREQGWATHWVSLTQWYVLAFMFGLVLMPYVFLLVRANLQRQGLQLFHAARSLGYAPIPAFFKGSLPAILPSITASAALVTMETLADYGASSLFAIPTLTQSIYRSWFNYGSTTIAAQMAIGLIGIVALLLWWIQSTPKARQQNSLPPPAKPPHSRLASYLMAVYAWSIFGIAFVLPFSLLLWQGLSDLTVWHQSNLLDWFGHSLSLAILSAVLALIVAILAVWPAHQHLNRPSLNAIPRLLSLGYAVPGTALAVAILLTWHSFGLQAGIAALIFAYLVRFLSLSIQSVQSGLNQFSPRLLEAAQLHGYRPWQRHFKVTLPLLSPHLLAASLMVGIEVLKELPATLMMRPFNYDTLAIIAYQYSQDERIPEASAAALMIVLAGLAGLVIMKLIETKTNAH